MNGVVAAVRICYVGLMECMYEHTSNAIKLGAKLKFDRIRIKVSDT